MPLSRTAGGDPGTAAIFLAAGRLTGASTAPAGEQRDIARALAAFAAAAGEVPDSRWPAAPLHDGRQLA